MRWNRCVSDQIVIHVPVGDLDLDATLQSGQAYRWYRKDGVWIGVVGDSVWRLSLDGETLLAERVAGCSSVGSSFDDEVRTFFRLDVDLGGYFAGYRDSHPALAEAIERFRGMRVIRQPAADALIG